MRGATASWSADTELAIDLRGLRPAWRSESCRARTPPNARRGGGMGDSDDRHGVRLRRPSGKRGWVEVPLCPLVVSLTSPPAALSVFGRGLTYLSRFEPQLLFETLSDAGRRAEPSTS
jgi:hypothetical protein